MMPEDDGDGDTVTVAALAARGAARLPGAAARHESELLLGHALGRDRAWLYAHARDAVPDSGRELFLALLERRARGEPVAHIVGSRGFWTLELAVGPETLIPRPETELLVELALERIADGKPARIADLGTGSGAVALAIASERPQAQVLATDASAAALAIARGNARTLGIGNVSFARGDWMAALGGARFDLVVSNPPYIAEGDPHLQRGDLRHEPRSALASGVDGLDAIRSIVAAAPAHLVAGGWLLFEHGHDQGEAARRLLRAAGFDAVATWRDLESRDRVSGGVLPG